MASVHTLREEPIGVFIYVGLAPPGSAESATVWQLYRMEETSEFGRVTLFADGDSDFNNAWDDRLIKSYS